MMEAQEESGSRLGRGGIDRKVTPWEKAHVG